MKWITHIRDITHHSHTWHNSSMCVTWLIHVRDMTHPCACHDSSMCVTWLIHVRDMTHPCACHDSFISAAHTTKKQTAASNLLHFGYNQDNYGVQYSWGKKSKRKKKFIVKGDWMGYGNMPQNWHGIDMHSFFFSHPALTTHLRRDVLVIYSTLC